MKAIHPPLFLFNYTINIWRTKTNTFSPCKMKEPLKETNHRNLSEQFWIPTLLLHTIHYMMLKRKPERTSEKEM